VDKKGRLSVHGIYLEPAVLENLLRIRHKRYGEFPILIRGDLRAMHQQVRAVMDMCTDIGIAKVNIAGVYEHKKSDPGKSPN
jgi:biopolymer transport protein ExbD